MAAQVPIALRPRFKPRENINQDVASYVLHTLSWKIITKENGCWEWVGQRSEGGYGAVKLENGNVRATMSKEVVKPLAKEVGVSAHTIKDIIGGKTWKEIVV